MSNGTKLLLLRGVIGVAILNFAVFYLMALYLGGDAENGRVQAGHFYLASHGNLTEVSKAIFSYSLFHSRSIWITHPIGMIAGYFYIRLKRDQPGVQADRPQKVGPG